MPIVVLENISAYGGEKENVTIFGESAGGWSVEALMSSEKTVGYFHRAISQSGPLKNPFLKSAGANELNYKFAMNYFDVQTLDKLKTLLMTTSIDELLQFYKEMPQFTFVGRCPAEIVNVLSMKRSLYFKLTMVRMIF